MDRCQSCGMPLDETTKSKKDEIYCVYCQDQITGQLKSWGEVRQGCIGAAIRLLGKTKEEAEKMVEETLPKLPRWQKST